MAKSGLNVDKSFKCQAFIEVVNVVNNTFPNACMDADNVENHMRTVVDETYCTYVEGQPKAKEYLNKPIPLLEELCLVAEDDHATGDHARSFYDQFGGTTPEDNNVPEPNEPMDCEAFEANSQIHEVLRSTTNKTTARSSRIRRTMGENVGMENVGDKLGQLVASIGQARKKTWKKKLSDALWDIKGYDNKDMGMVFGKLMKNKAQAELFYLRKSSLRKIWLDEYIESLKNSSP
ncbi:Fumarate reductase/succinate dehydrogenase flavoprotein-like C-terminal protein [Dioscorea alata]|uniref:Fumarate reductase/succinate dehydrogenase flavoprotein-like C-terminal protein n=1 Tax=Dioscorea alata TaxID=55571 RepID=A0ACB7TTA3_DIOAL|nr:Fumarate reductase/succinate dehydrogenase flavoprotein-like C-terminal protein [Dioscorea alata]